MNRRGFLLGVGAATFSIVRPETLMPIRAIETPTNFILPGPTDRLYRIEYHPLKGYQVEYLEPLRQALIRTMLIPPEQLK